MGIHDREYYRDKTRDSGWFSGSASACKTIILLNIAVFAFGHLFDCNAWLRDWFFNDSEQVLLHGQVWRLVTNVFLHDPNQIWHILMNMLILWFVGRDMEAFYGTREFWWFYLSAAVVSSLCWVALDYSRGLGHTAAGASGAVMAVMAIYTFYNPHREVILYFIPVQMWLLLTIFAGSDFYNVWIRSAEPVAFMAHLGGIGYAAAFKFFDLRLKHLGRVNLKALKRLIPGATPKLRLVYPPDPPKREKPTVRPSAPPSPASASSPNPGPSPAPSSWTSPSKAASTPRSGSTAVASEESLEARFDEILVKIATEGRGSLTEEEKRICEEASKRARSRRGERIP